MVSKEKYYELKAAGLCVKCAKPRQDSPSQVRCAPCHERFKARTKAKLNSDSAKAIEEFDASTLCVVCETPLQDYDVACRTCLTRKEFKLIDALKKYGAFCRVCNTDEVEDLCIASADITKPMPLPNPDRYRAICHHKSLHPNYTVLCNECYYDRNMHYIKTAYKLFAQEGAYPKTPDLEVENLPKEQDNIVEAEYEIE